MTFPLHNRLVIMALSAFVAAAAVHVQLLTGGSPQNSAKSGAAQLHVKMSSVCLQLVPLIKRKKIKSEHEAPRWHESGATCNSWPLHYNSPFKKQLQKPFLSTPDKQGFIWFSEGFILFQTDSSLCKASQQTTCVKATVSFNNVVVVDWRQYWILWSGFELQYIRIFCSSGDLLIFENTMISVRDEGLLDYF